MARESRDAQARNNQGRKKVWQRPSRLDTPNLNDGCHHRWVRKAMLGQDDNTNLHLAQREGYEPVPAEDMPPGYDNEIGGLVLCRLDPEIAESRNEQMRAETQGQMQSVDQNMMREAGEDRRYGEFVGSRKSRSTTGARSTQFQQ